jgi:hypothetical protein
MKRIVSIVLFVLFTIFIYSQDSGIIYGPDWSYLIQAPEGFKWDNNSLQKQGIWGLFYKADQVSYKGSLLNMYINPVRKGGDYPTDLDALIKWDTEFYKQNNPGLVISYYKDFELGDHSIAKVYYFDDEKRKYNMFFGYVTEQNASFVFVLSARSIEERSNYEKAYSDLLKSFIYMNKK